MPLKIFYASVQIFTEVELFNFRAACRLCPHCYVFLPQFLSSALYSHFDCNYWVIDLHQKERWYEREKDLYWSSFINIRRNMHNLMVIRTFYFRSPRSGSVTSGQSGHLHKNLKNLKGNFLSYIITLVNCKH